MGVNIAKAARGAGFKSVEAFLDKHAEKLSKSTTYQLMYGPTKPFPKILTAVADVLQIEPWILVQPPDVAEPKIPLDKDAFRKVIFLEAAAVLEAYGKATPELQAEIRAKLQLGPSSKSGTAELDEFVRERETPAQPQPKRSAGDQD